LSEPVRPFFLITIDTEGDDLWSAPREITTRNSHFLPRFQDLCEEFHLKPTYLVNYEMAMCPEFRAFGRDVVGRKTGEIGMHLHAWNAPPIEPLTENDHGLLTFLIDYPTSVLKSKIERQTKLLADVFGVQPVSHRAGRWALDARYVDALVENGYRVDCSVTPGVSWRSGTNGRPGSNGSDYRSFPSDTYWMTTPDIARPDGRASGGARILEVPMTIYTSRSWSWVRPRVARAALNRVAPEASWLRPTGRNAGTMLRVLRRTLEEGKTYAEFMLHSSEFMPGGSPTFPSERHIETLYAHLRRLFTTVSQYFRGATLQEYFEWYTARP